MHRHIYFALIVLLLSCANDNRNSNELKTGITAEKGIRVNSIGMVLPDDAADVSHQVIRFMSPEPRSLDPSIYPYDTELTIFPFEGLLHKDEFWNPIPAAANKWESEDGRIWTFQLRSGMRWSDGSPLTAHDYVYSYQRMVDPASQNVYAFFYYDIKNAEAIAKGRNDDIASLGVTAIDDTTLVIETEKNIPYLPHIVSFGDAVPVPRRIVEKYGRKWTEPENIVSNAGFKVSEWVHGSHMTLVPDPYYNGPHKPYLEKVIHPFRDPGSATILPYESNEVDIENVDVNDLERIERDPALKKELVSYNGMTTWYMFFRTRLAPFNDIRIREAFTRVIDRKNICDIILRGGAVPAYGMIPPGFREYKKRAYVESQGFDPGKAKSLMREAGYPNGKGFPEQDLWLRAPNPSDLLVAVGIQTMLKEYLGVKVNIRTADRGTYMHHLYQWNMNFGLLNFGADFLDPRNILDMIWHSQPQGYGRQDWSNPSFDSFVEEAAAEMNQAKRDELYEAATASMLEDYPAVFLFHSLAMQLRKPWVRGYAKNQDGTAGPFHWYKLYVAESNN
tara:strand:+ start:109551 stop:111233 length:1683 start_codon:yes stop_codon:yes gene_type:complete